MLPITLKEASLEGQRTIRWSCSWFASSAVAWSFNHLTWIPPPPSYQPIFNCFSPHHRREGVLIIKSGFAGIENDELKFR